MVKTKGLSATQSNWEAAIPGVRRKYEAGVGRTTDFLSKAIEGEALYVERVTAAAAAGRRAAGLNKAGEAKWKTGAAGKGAKRIAGGMTAAKADYGRGMAPVLSTIEGVSIPARTADVATNVANRVTPIAVALRAMKEGV